MISVYHRADHDCIVVEERSEQNEIFIHIHQMAGGMNLREVQVKSPVDVLFHHAIDYEYECDQSRRK